MTAKDFDTVFTKLAEYESDANWSDPTGSSSFRVSIPDVDGAELDEVSELRRIALEVMEPEICLYTTT